MKSPNRTKTPSRHWQSYLPTLILVTLSSVASQAAHADQVRITAVNDNYDPNHAEQIDVHAGDVITLSADLLDDSNGFAALGDPVEDFIWYASDSNTDICDASLATNCLTTSNFQVTNYGVSFYVPTMTQAQLMITVTSSDPNAVENGGETVDTIILNNLDYQTGYTPPLAPITTAADYPYDQFDPDRALYGQGNWVFIGGVRYWAPYTYVNESGDSWAPYRNGYWVWDDSIGYTWVSYDPWGWATDHYGVWRNHADYGWVWLPFADNHYEPNCVSWFDANDGYVGWYPYFPGYADAYVADDSLGFSDGYWQGYDGCRGYGQSDYYWTPGFTVVEAGSFGNVNIVDVYTQNSSVVVVEANRCSSENGFSALPGRANNLNDAHTYMASRVGNIAESQSRPAGRGNIMNPTPVRQVPPQYHNVAQSGFANHKAPVGSVIDSRNGAGGKMIPPTTNGRGISAPPRVTDPTTGKSQPVPVRAKNPGTPNGQNPTQSQRPVSQKPQPAPSLPVYNPSKPAPAPVHAQPKPTPVHNQPTPGPVHNQPTPGPVHNQPTPGPVHNQPTPGPVHNQPTPGPVHNQPTPGPVHSQPTPGPVHNQPTPGPVHNQPTPGPVHNQPTPGPVHNQPTPGPVHSQPTPGPVHNQPTPGPVHSQPTPGPVHNQPTPGPVHNQPTPGPVHNQPTPGPVHNQPQPAPVHNQPAPVHNQPQPTPVHSQPTPGPVHNQPQPAPVHNQPQPTPVHNQPQPAPVHNQPAPAPGGSHKPKIVTGDEA